MMHFLQLETSWHCAALWVVVPSAPLKIPEVKLLRGFFVYAGMAKYGILEQFSVGLKQSV